MSEETRTPGGDPQPGEVVDLDALEREAVALEGGAGTVEVAPKASTAADLLGALEMGRLIVAPSMGWWPEFGRVWSDAQLGKIAEAGGAIMDRHGWSLGDLLSAWGPYLALAAAAAPPALATYAAIKARPQERQGAPGAAAPPAGGAPAGGAPA